PARAAAGKSQSFDRRIGDAPPAPLPLPTDPSLPMNARYAAAAKLRLGLNWYTLVLVVRAVAVFVVSFSIAYGFLSGTRASPYDPHLFAIGTSTLFALACVAIAAQFARKRLLQAEIARLAERIEELSDRNWELGEAEDRARRFLEAQG